MAFAFTLVYINILSIAAYNVIEFFLVLSSLSGSTFSTFPIRFFNTFVASLPQDYGPLLFWQS